MKKKILVRILLVALIGIIILSTASPALAAKNHLTPTEIEGLLFMREEEKLARDVYIYLYTLYGLGLFDTISHSEQHHMDAVLNLLNTYGLPDPASSQQGVFNNQDLQALYDACIQRGSQSISEALNTGGAIEEVDILDVRYYLANTNKANLQQVYGMLLNGSYHHLRAFANTLLTQTGEIYQPQYLDPQDYQAIMNGGGGGGWGGGGGGCRRCGP